MKYLATFLFASLTTLVSVFACDADAENISYALSSNPIIEKVDVCLTNAENCLFSNHFEEALLDVENAEGLLHLTHDENDHRKLRTMFDKAVILTCLEGVTENSQAHFVAFNNLLATKRCANTNKSQPNLFDQNGHWPIIGENAPISIGECLERVGSTAKSLEIASAALKIHPASRIAIATAIYTISQQARGCCTHEGFWKTCIQPVVDAWKKVELFGIPPDPSWD